MIQTEGRLISLEGIECSGKSTQSRLITEYLTAHDIKALPMHEPGGTVYGEALRAVLKHPGIALPAVYRAVEGNEDFAGLDFKAELNLKRTAITELFLFEAVRAEYANALIEILSQGISVISDRLMDSTTAYQGGGRKLNQSLGKDLIERMHRIAMQDLWPDKTFFLHIGVEEMQKRMATQSDDKNSFFEKECGPDFYQRAEKVYFEISHQEPERFIVIDGKLPPLEVFEQIRPYLDSLFGIV